MKTLVRGFTLIELLIVVAMISIMLAIAVPSFVTFISNYRVTSAMNDFLQGITLTRNEAMKQGRRVLMLPNLNDAARTPSVLGDWKNGWTIFVDTNNSQTLDGLEFPVFKHDTLAPSIVITNSSGGGNPPFTDLSNKTYVSFDGTGYPRQFNGAFVIGGIVMTDSIGTSVNVRTLCLGSYGRARIVKDAPGCSSG